MWENEDLMYENANLMWENADLRWGDIDLTSENAGSAADGFVLVKNENTSVAGAFSFKTRYTLHHMPRCTLTPKPW